MNKKIEKIIIKFLMNAANIEDLETLKDWLKKPENKHFFDSYIKTNYAIDINMKQFDTENAKKEYLRKIKQDKKILNKHKFRIVFKYAAVAVIIFGLGYILKNNIFNTQIDNTPIIVNNNIETGTDKAILSLENGTNITLTKGQNYTTNNISSNGEELIYTCNNTKTKLEVVYNHLTIPRGGQFHLTLSDGTKVWINSESKLKYPVNFKDGEARQVELVYGEAYFDVSPSNKHNGSKFKVLNQHQEVEVLGTEFNIKAYKDETNIYTTLIEGKVAISIDNTNKFLKPREQLSFNYQTGEKEIKEVNLFRETSWIKGVFSFKNKPLKDIMKVLSRWYDMNVIFINKNLEKELFIGTLHKNQNIEDILLSIKKTNIINTYEINNKTVIIK